MTPERLAEIRAADQRVKIQGGTGRRQFMRRADVIEHGEVACLHRRELLDELERLEQEKKP